MSKLMFSVICMTHVLELSIQLDKHQPDKSRKHWRCAQQWNSSINEEQLIVIVIGFVPNPGYLQVTSLFELLAINLMLRYSEQA